MTQSQVSLISIIILVVQDGGGHPRTKIGAKVLQIWVISFRHLFIKNTDIIEVYKMPETFLGTS